MKRPGVATTAWAVASAVWASFILALLLMPGSSVPSLPAWLAALPIDKGVHAALFFVQSVLLYATARSAARPEAPSRHTLLALAALTLAYGIATELLQQCAVQRSADAVDALADASGIILAGLVLLVRRRR